MNLIIEQVLSVILITMLSKALSMIAMNNDIGVFSVFGELEDFKKALDLLIVIPNLFIIEINRFQRLISASSEVNLWVVSINVVRVEVV